MPKKSQQQIDLELKTEELKQATLNEYKQMYDDEQLEKLYKTEFKTYIEYLEKLTDTKAREMFLNNLKKKHKNKTEKQISLLLKIDNEDEINEIKEKIREQVKKNMGRDDYEKAFPESCKYIKASIFHGYDGSYYVLNKNDKGHILPLEYNQATFTSTYLKYIGNNCPLLKLWFDSYSKKVVLTINNTQPRTFSSDGTNYLNLFAGYKNCKTAERDLESIERGKEGVKFILNHIKRFWVSSNEKYYIYNMKWIYKLVSGYKMKTMLYLKGKMGRGKTAIVNFLKKVLGAHLCLTLSNDATFMTEFNGSLLGMALCCLDEIVHDFDSFRSLYNKLKPYITDETMSYRNLYEKIKVLQNMTSFIMTGNYDMLKLDDPSKGDDRRICVNDVYDFQETKEYCVKLDAYLENHDVQYAFFWHCIDNCDHDFNELIELKQLPASETKKQMISQSLDSCTLYLKSIVNDAEYMNKDIKPTTLYDHYNDFMKAQNDKKTCLNKQSFLSKLKEYNLFITLKDNVRKDGNNPTNYVYIDREKMINLFREKYFWNEYDNINDKLNDKKSMCCTFDMMQHYKKLAAEYQKQWLDEISKEAKTVNLATVNLSTNKKGYFTEKIDKLDKRILESQNVKADSKIDERDKRDTWDKRVLESKDVNDYCESFFN